MILLLAAAAALGACKPAEKAGRNGKSFAAVPQAASVPTATATPDKTSSEDRVPSNAVDGIEDGGTLALEPNMQPLVVTGLRNDLLFSTATIELSRLDGTIIGTAEWPEVGETKVIEGVCGGPSGVTVRLQVKKGGRTYTTADPQCFVGTSVGTTLTFGFEDDCDSLSVSGIDDLVASFVCPEGLVTVEGLRIDRTIDVADWVD